MSEPFFKAIPNERDGKLAFVMNRAGFELLQKVLSRSHPNRQDSLREFDKAKNRVSGGLMAGSAVMGWTKK